MKKIVALVLSLVMVLGLATTAFAAPVTYTVDGVSASDMTTSRIDSTAVTVVPAVASYIDVAGVLHGGNVKYYSVYPGYALIPCTADTAGALVLYYEDTKTVFDYVIEGTEADAAYEAVGAAFTDLGTACDQYNNQADKTAKYYTYVGSYGVSYVVKATESTGKYLLVDGEQVEVSMTPMTLNAHKWVVEKDAANKILGAKCSLCDLEASFAVNKAVVPTGYKTEAKFGGWLYWNPAPVATTPSTDKVESAQTFDAGIAMYVGMSVMAAAGSAVVLKKKD